MCNIRSSAVPFVHFISCVCEVLQLHQFNQSLEPHFKEASTDVIGADFDMPRGFAYEKKRDSKNSDKY